MATDHTPRPLASARARARRRARYREVCALLSQRAELLPPHERELIHAVYAEGRTAMSLARLDDPDPSTVALRAAVLRRRVRRLARRLLDPAFELVRSSSSTWPPAMSRVGHAVIVQGLSMREATRTLKLSFHTVRASVAAIHALAAANRALPTLPQVAA